MRVVDGESGESSQEKDVTNARTGKSETKIL